MNQIALPDVRSKTPGRDFDMVLFDLDGTLIATAPELCDAVNDSLLSLGLPPVSVDRVSRWVGHGTRELVAQALSFAGKAAIDDVRGSAALDGAWKSFDQHYRSRCATTSYLYPRVLDVLRQLHGEGVKLAVVTNKDRHYSGLLLEAHGLAPLLDMVVGGDTLATRKPSPEGVQHCLATLGVPAGRALFVGDSSVDVATARAAGVRVWAVPYGYNMGRDIAESQPDRIIDDVGALLDPTGA